MKLLLNYCPGNLFVKTRMIYTSYISIYHKSYVDSVNCKKEIEAFSCFFISQSFLHVKKRKMEMKFPHLLPISEQNLDGYW